MKFSHFDVQSICNEVQKKFGNNCGYLGRQMVVVSETCNPEFSITEEKFLALYVKKRIFGCIESDNFPTQLGITKFNNLILINHLFLQECFDCLLTNKILMK
jgi:hypothetical protein